MSAPLSTPDIEVVGSASGPAEHVSIHSLQPEIIIIGAGVAGCALAYSLSHVGRSVVLLERDLSEPDRIVGELLQPGGVEALEKLGMGGVLDGIDAVPVEGYCIVNGEEKIGIDYPHLEEMAGHTSNSDPNSGSSLTGATETSGGEVHVVEKAIGDGDSKLELEGRRLDNGKKWVLDCDSGKKEGRSFHHGRLISALRRKVIDEAPGVTVLEATVRDLVFCEHTNRVIGVSAAFKPKSAESSLEATRLNTDDPEQQQPSASSSSAPSTSTSTSTKPIVKKLYAPITIIADGCFSKFRQTPGTRTRTPDTKSHFVGLVLTECDLPIKHMGTVCLTPSGPVLLYQIGQEKGEVRMLVDIKGKLPSVGDGSLKQHIIDKYLPFVPSNIQSSLINALNNQRLRTMPNSFLPPSIQGLSTTLSGAVLVGDAYNMRHPLTGGGMTVAFNDAVLLSQYLRPSKTGEDGLRAGREGLEDWEKVSEKLREWFWERKKLSGVVNVLSMALYSLFGGSDEPDFEVLKEGCFKYLSKGGENTAGPIGLLSALTPRPFILFYHFFSVALFSIWILLSQGPPHRRSKNAAITLISLPLNLLLSVRVFYTACVVLLPFIATEFKI
ncbi:hypothetical protein IAR55_002637 [Kwoniella newhampshirensis]|uniref:squalene monooxygenase n=1 Tax=Kwoniella newhampshirensis TaxID=1651941 RepID=A0AAW0YXF8_9TREE